MSDINTCVDELVSFWKQANLAKPPFVHPKDNIPSHHIESGIGCYNDYVQAFQSNELSHRKYHLNLLPTPYSGNLRTAKVLLLFANPGVHPADYIAEEMFEQYFKDVKRNIYQENNSNYCLDPQYAWTSAFSWWEKKFRGLAKHVAKNNIQFNNNYSGALSAIANTTASLELVPYHSQSQPYFGEIDLQSSKEAKEFAVRFSEIRGNKVIVARASRQWNLNSRDNVIVYSAGQARTASMGPNSEGGKAILSSLGIS